MLVQRRVLLDQELSRVRQRLSAVVLDFCSEVIQQQPPHFRLEDLYRFVVGAGVDCAPNSPYRILRQLQSEGLVEYDVISRGQSLYRVTQVEAQQRLFSIKRAEPQLEVEASRDINVEITDINVEITVEERRRMQRRRS